MNWIDPRPLPASLPAPVRPPPACSLALLTPERSHSLSRPRSPGLGAFALALPSRRSAPLTLGTSRVAPHQRGGPSLSTRSEQPPRTHPAGHKPTVPIPTRTGPTILRSTPSVVVWRRFTCFPLLRAEAPRGLAAALFAQCQLWPPAPLPRPPRPWSRIPAHTGALISHSLGIALDLQDVINSQSSTIRKLLEILLFPW